MDQTLLLYYLSSVAGLIIIAGGIWLLYKEKIYIDRESKQVTEVEIPFIGKLKTKVPALALFLLGFVPLLYPLAHTAALEPMVAIEGHVDGGPDSFPVEIYTVVRSHHQLNPGDFNFEVPSRGDLKRDYEVLYVVGSTLASGYKPTELKGRLHLDKFNSPSIAQRFVPELKPLDSSPSKRSGK